MAVNQNGSGRGSAGPNGSDINDVVNRLGGPRAVIVLAVVVVIAIVAVTSITSGISDTNQQTEQRAEAKQQQEEEAARAQRKKEKEARHQEEAKKATVLTLDEITDETLRSDLAFDADEDGNISQETADKATSIDIESFDSLPLLADFHNIATLGIDDYDSENYDISSISNITRLSIGDCSVPQVDLTRFPQLRRITINRLASPVDTLNAKNMSSLTNVQIEGLDGSIGTLDLSGDVSLEHLNIKSRVDTLDLCGAGREDAFNITFTPNCVGKILYDSDTSSGMVEFLQKVSSDYGYTMEQQ